MCLKDTKATQTFTTSFKTIRKILKQKHPAPAKECFTFISRKLKKELSLHVSFSITPLPSEFTISHKEITIKIPACKNTKIMSTTLYYEQPLTP